MPAQSKAQQRFFGVVKGIQKGTGKGSGKAKKAFLSGFEGYGFGDIRNTEINDLIDKFKQKENNLRLIAITPSQYSGLETISIYGI